MRSAGSSCEGPADSLPRDADVDSSTRLIGNRRLRKRTFRYRPVAVAHVGVR
jgi:hypothetical protein